MPVDAYQGQMAGLGAQTDNGEEITPNDSADLETVPKYLLVGSTGGTIRCHDKNGNVVNLYGVAGQVIMFRPHRILNTGTTATPITAVY